MKASCDLLILGSGRLATIILGLLTIRAVTTILTPDQYGQLALLVVVQTFCGLFLVNPVGMYINRHTHEWWDDGSLLARFGRYRQYIFSVSIIGGIAALVVSQEFPPAQIAVIVLAMIVMVNGGTWNATWIPLLNMVGQRGVAVSWGLITSVTGLLASVLLCAVWPTATTWFIGQAFGLVLGAIGAGRALRRGVLPRQIAAPCFLVDRQAIMAYCFPLAVGTGFMWLQLSGYRLLVERYWGLSLLGYLSVGLLLAGQIWSMVESLAQQFLSPLFYRRVAQIDKDSSTSALSDLLNVMVPIYLLLSGASYIGAPYILKLLVAPQYADADKFLRLGIGIEFCRVMANLLSSAAHVTKRTRSIILPYGAGALVVFIFLVISGEYHFEIEFVPMSLLCAALVMLFVMWKAMSREIKLFPDFKRWLVAAMMMISFVLASHWLQPPKTWGEEVVALILIGLLSAAMAIALLKKNPSLQRLIIVDLRNGNSRA